MDSKPTCKRVLTEQVGVLEGSHHSFFIVELLVDLSLLIVLALLDVDVNFVLLRQTPQQFDPDHEPNERCHTAIGDRGGEVYSNLRSLEHDMDVLEVQDCQIFERVRMLRIHDVSNHVKHYCR